MDPSELLERLAQSLTDLGIPYIITGSMATIAYGEPRFTNDIDVVIRLFEHQVTGLCDAFPAGEFYISHASVREALQHHSQFNILHPGSGLKIDVMVADNSDFNQSRFARAHPLSVAPNVNVVFASPEDVIIKKLEFFRQGGSDKHLRDIAGVLAVMDDQIDRTYIERWARQLGLTNIWNLVNND
ncbi:MAG: hypothetical protein ACC742_12320 [Thermoanaerobaculales bacterium]